MNLVGFTAERLMRSVSIVGLLLAASAGSPAIALADPPHWEQTLPALRIHHLGFAEAKTSRRVELTPDMSAGGTSAAPCN